MTAAAQASAAPRQRPSRTLAILSIGVLAYSLAQTIILPALPGVQEETGTSAATATWLLTGFLLVSSVATPIMGRLGDMFGKERMMLVALAMFGLGSVICALGSSSIVALIAGRVVQGTGGAIFPLSFGIIRDEFPPERVAQSIGLISAMFGIGGGGGLVLAGVVIDHLSLAWMFWGSAGLTAVAAWATWRYVPESPVRVPARIDWGGGVLLSVALICLLLGVSRAPNWGWISSGVLGLLGVGGLGLALFVRYERRVSDPMVDLRLMMRRGVWTANLTAFAVGFAMFGSFIVIPQIVTAPDWTGYGLDLAATAVGLVMLPSSLVMLVAAPMSGWLGQRFGSRLPLALGAGCGVAAYSILAAAHDGVWTLALGAGVLGVGIALALAAMANLVVAAVPATHTGVATGINTISRNIGGAIGGQIVATVLASNVLARGLPSGGAYTVAFMLSGCAALAALAACALIPRPHGRQAHP